MIYYPQHEKLKALEVESRAISEFLEWINVEGIALSRPDMVTEALPRCWHLPIDENSENLLARFFDIDLSALEAEKRTMLSGLGAES